MTRRCGTCQHLQCGERSDGIRVLLWEHPCHAPFEMPEITRPASVSITVNRRWMPPEAGADCPAWEQWRSVYGGVVGHFL